MYNTSTYALYALILSLSLSLSLCVCVCHCLSNIFHSPSEVGIGCVPHVFLGRRLSVTGERFFTASGANEAVDDNEEKEL